MAYATQRPGLWTATTLLVVGCYSKPDDAGQGTDAATDGGTGTSSASGSSADASASATSPSTTASNTSDPTATDSTGSSATGATTDATTGAPAACMDGTADPGELCLDVEPEHLTVDANPFDVDVGDIDLDGELDIVTISRPTNDTGSITVLESDGLGGFAAPEYLDAPQYGFRVHVADGDADGDDDIVASGYGTMTWSNVDGSFLSAWDAVSIPGPSEASVGELLVTELNGDGLLDIMSSEAYGYGYSFGDDANDRWRFPNGPDGNFPVAGEGASGIIALDFDADGDVDGIALNQYGSTASVVAGDGNGGFADHGTVQVCPGQYAGARHGIAGDVDGDGTVDLVVTCMDGDFTVLPGNGDGTFADYEIHSLDGAFRPYLSDIDADGDLDVLVSSSSLDRLVMYLNDGTGTLELAEIDFIVAGPVHGAAIVDLNKDGALDVLVPFDDGNGGQVAVYLAEP